MCDCIEKVNGELRDKNTVLVVPYWAPLSGIGEARQRGVMVATQKLNTKLREPAVKLLAVYCPFCGEKYEPVEEHTQ